MKWVDAMRRRIIMLSLLLFLQFVAAIAFVPCISHLLPIWYHHESGWWKALQAEYALGGWIMLAEIIVVVVAFLSTVGFEIWLIVSEVKPDKQMREQLNRIESKL